MTPLVLRRPDIAAARAAARIIRRHRVLRVALRTAILLAGLCVCILAFEAVRLPDPRALIRAIASSTVLLDRRGDPIRFELTAREELAPRVPLERFHPLLRQATLAAEDTRFLSHGGVDGLAVARSLWLNLKSGRVVSGASTITMQVARLLRPLERGWYSKFREMLLAARIESVLSKDGILELYLNLSPYGGNTRGAEAAAWRYFGRSAADLSLAEAALVAGLPQAPSRLRPDRRPEKARIRRDWVLDRMASLGMIQPEACAEAKASGISTVQRPLPRSAPHFGDWALRRVAQGERVRTTLDPDIQRMAEEAVRQRLEALGPQGVRNGSIVVAETPSGRIRAMAGSQDFFAPRGGQVNGALALRSPGSLLKPFIYGLAFERGIAGPDTILQDRPLRFPDGYGPRNFTGQFAGPVPAREALVRSLNVPAVDLLSRLGVAPTVERMRGFGIRSIRGTGDRFGLSMGLGGVEVSLLEMVEAYAALGRGGRHRPLSFREDDPPAPEVEALLETAALLVAEILEGVAWPAGERDAGLKLPRVAVKTGTSFGFRDAWAVAFTPLWTVGVWFGNFDGQPSRALTGQSAAVPAALVLLRRLQPEGGPWFRPPPKDGGPQGQAGQPPRELRRPYPGGVDWVLPADGEIIQKSDRSGGKALKLRAEIQTPLPAGGSPSGAQAGAPAGDGKVFSWFIDGTFTGRSATGETLLWPLRQGAHRITLVGPGGKARDRTVTVLP